VIEEPVGLEGALLREKVQQARALRPLILEHRDESDEERRLAQPVVEALVELGAFRAVIPRAAGGEEWDWLTFMRVVEELSSVDGAVGWTMGVGGGVGGIVSGWLSADAARAVFSSDPIGLTTGAGQRNGLARAVDGGYRLTGHWSFASGAAHASWFMGGYSLDDPAANPPPGAGPMLFMPRHDVTIVDTWSVGGMRGTSSYDFEVDDVFVPVQYAADPANTAPHHAGPLYRLPFLLVLGSGLGPLALGMARGAVDCFTDVMAVKKDGRSGASLADRLTVQERLAQAEAAIRSARAFLYEAANDAWETVCAGESLSARQVAMFRLANMNATQSGRNAVDLVYHASGTTGIYTSNPLERFFRDIHVATQHRQANPEEMYQVGAELLREAGA
jgi:alkylation response protein AidB-like acyl-CoA dehydrogenase